MTDGSRQNPFLLGVSGMDDPLEDLDVAGLADFYRIEPFHFPMPLTNEMLMTEEMINQIVLHIATQPNLPFQFHYPPVFFEYGTILLQESQALYQEILSQWNSYSLNPHFPQSPPLSFHENSSVEDNGGTNAEVCLSPILSVHDAMMVEGSQEACSHMHTPSNTPSLPSSFSATGPVVLSCSPLSFHSDFFSDDRQEISTTADHGSSGDDFDSEEEKEEVEALGEENDYVELQALNATLLGSSDPEPFGQDGEESMEGGPEDAYDGFFG